MAAETGDSDVVSMSQAFSAWLEPWTARLSHAKLEEGLEECDSILTDALQRCQLITLTAETRAAVAALPYAWATKLAPQFVVTSYVCDTADYHVHSIKKMNRVHHGNIVAQLCFWYNGDDEGDGEPAFVVTVPGRDLKPSREYELCSDLDIREDGKEILASARALGIRTHGDITVVRTELLALCIALFPPFESA
jgi:hypothetical protein